FVLCVINFELKNHFCSRRIYKSGYNISVIGISQRFFMFCLCFNDWCCKTVILHMLVRNSVMATKSLATIFEIIDIVAVPNNAQCIGLVKLYLKMFGML